MSKFRNDKQVRTFLPYLNIEAETQGNQSYQLSLLLQKLFWKESKKPIFPCPEEHIWKSPWLYSLIVVQNLPDSKMQMLAALCDYNFAWIFKTQ